jgi:GR25 family glycosyltransferase involved in LPS biosynthesis
VKIKKREENFSKVCFGVFHIESSTCGERHIIKDQLIEEVASEWSNLQVETFHFATLEDAENSASLLGYKFSHIEEDRKIGDTGFMKGEIGLWLGTVSALKKFLNSDFEVLFLFEDDVQIKSGGASQIACYVSDLPKYFDTFILYTPKHQNFIYGRKRHVWSYIRKNYLYDDPNKVTRVYQHSCLAAYAVSRKGAKKILDSIAQEITMPLDWHIFRGPFNSFSFKPNGPKFFSYIELESTIQKDRVIRQNPDNSAS